MSKLLTAFACVAALALSGCTTTLDTTIQQNLPKICSVAATAHSAFIIVASTGDVKPSTVAKEAAAFDALQIVCENPEGVTASNALVIAAQAYATITLALREARNVQ